MQLRPSRSPRYDDAPLFEHAQMLHHSEAGHLELGLELCQRQAVELEQAIEERAPCRIGERFEHQVVALGHANKQYVTIWSHVKRDIHARNSDRSERVS